MSKCKYSGSIRGEKYSPLHIDTNTIQGSYYFGDILEVFKELVPRYDGKIQLIYMDPPFFTGQTFRYQQPIGIKGWMGDKDHVISHVAYIDRYEKEVFFNMMKEVFFYVHRLLSNEGCLYVHIDYRTSAYLKIMLDDIFGEDNFLNEIIWHYRSGGRAKRHFSRKHDNILFYRKSKDYYFNIDAVGVPRGLDKRNNMKKNIDGNGRIYWSIRSAGKEYKYYADDKIYPSDVWDDIPHLHQKNPERTGYDTQKPEKLLERIILASSRPGDLIADFFAGSGTTLAVAQRHGRDWIGVDNSIFSLHTCRKRLLKNSIYNNIEFLYHNEYMEYDTIFVKNHSLIESDGKFYRLSITKLIEDIDTIDYWSVGYELEGIYNGISYSMRTVTSPEIAMTLTLNRNAIDKDGDICIHTVDVYGNQAFYKLKEE